MKVKKLIGAVLALAVLLIGAVSVWGLLDSGIDEISYDEECIKGDISAADGLIVERAFTYDGRCQWNTKMTFISGGFEAETRGSFVKKADEEEEEGITFKCHEAVPEDAVDKAAAEAFEKGESVLRCKDYLKYYEITSALFDGPDEKALSEYFKIPVDDDATIVYEYDGEYDQVGHGVTGTEEISMDKFEGCGRTYLYLPYAKTFDWLMGRTQEEIEKVNGFTKMLDESEIPGGYGLYEYTMEDGSIEIENVFKPDGGGRIENIREVEDTLIITTCEDKVIYVNVFDPEKKEVIQRLEIGKWRLPEELEIDDYAASTSELFIQDGYIWVFAGDSIAILEKKDGKYEKVLSYDRGYDLGIYPNENMALAYDGSKAAIAGLSSLDWNGYLWSFGFTLAVIDDTGLIYSGNFRNALDETLGERKNPDRYEYYYPGYMKASWND